MTRVLTILGHPARQSFNRSLAEAYTRGAREAGAEAGLVALGDLDFDPILHEGYGEVQPLEPDLLAVQRRIEEADHVHFVFPTWWGGPPALLKGFLDRALVPGWAFRARPGSLPERLLAGRSARMTATMDAPGWFYRLMYRSTLHGSFVRSVLWYVGFGPIRTRLLTDVGRASAEKRERWIAKAQEDGLRDAQQAARRAPARLPAPA
jgi:NAD(P)H dehydrogenase (quinone)